MYEDIKIKNGDIVRRKSDNMLCYIISIERMGKFQDYYDYEYCTEQGIIEQKTYTTEQVFEFVARQFPHLEPFAKIFIWKNRRWLAEMVSSCDEKYIWTLGHGRVLIDDVVPFTDPFTHATMDLFGKTERSLAMKMHRYKHSGDFFEHIKEIKQAY